MIGVLLGNHVGGGHGNTLATIAGAVGGGYIGNEVELRKGLVSAQLMLNSITNFPVLEKISTLEKLRKPHEISFGVSVVGKKHAVFWQ